MKYISIGYGEERKWVWVNKIGSTKLGKHVGIDEKGNVYTYCWVNDNGDTYDYERDGRIIIE